MIYQFLLEGIDGHQAKYRRDHFPLDTPIVKIGNTNNFKGTITKLLQNENAKTIHVDDVYKFTMLSDTIRNENRGIWTKFKNDSEKMHLFTKIGGLTGIVSALAIGVLSHLFAIAFAIGIISIAMFSYSFHLSHRSKQAQEQLKLWDDPINNYIEECRKLHIQEKLDEQVRLQAANAEKLANQPIIEDLKSKVKHFISELKELDSKVFKTDNTQYIDYDDKLQKIIIKISEWEQKILDYQAKIANENDPEIKKQLLKELQETIAGKENLLNVKRTLLKGKEHAIKRQEKEKQDFISNKERFHSLHINNISDIIKFFLSMKRVSKEVAYSIVEPYFNEYPELKNLDCIKA